ncbi:MADS-box transcription factor 23 isoform X2 [Cryptomeria japonica]|uniref:MADS-box transcription factor 23 isoform X2 n=1 Tax=Cryptomeria japonica TaxID=3369 RepID=UPI0027DA3756|nr:MADS-box transcription factor 23 isoform X2 [Cryptomeria japonica]
MAREKIEIKKIEKRSARHVTFSKRRRGLVKKAQELSILCEADVGLLIFSSTGKLFQYCSTSMKMILEKYQKYSNTNTTINNEQFIEEFENQEVIRIRQEIEDLNRALRRMHGKDLEGLTMAELQQLENKLEMGLRQVCSKKDECLFKEIYELQKQGIQYLEENARLHLQLNEMQSCHVEDNNAEELLFIEHLETHDHPQSSESTIGNPYNSRLHKASIIDNEASDTSLQLGLSI